MLVTAGCGGSPPRHPAGDADALDGVYRNTITFNEYIAAGVDRSWAAANAGTGVHTMTLHHGRARDDVRGTAIPTCGAHYSLRGHAITWAFDQAPGCNGHFTATWSLRDGELRLTDVKADDLGGSVQFGLKPFRKIG
jgi:hypothetical protein